MQPTCDYCGKPGEWIHATGISTCDRTKCKNEARKAATNDETQS